MTEVYPLTLHALPVPVADGHSRALSSPFPIRVEHTGGEFVVSDELLLCMAMGSRSTRRWKITGRLCSTITNS